MVTRFPLSADNDLVECSSTTAGPLDQIGNFQLAHFRATAVRRLPEIISRKLFLQKAIRAIVSNPIMILYGQPEISRCEPLG